MRRREREAALADHGGRPRAGRPVGLPSDLTLLAQAALAGSADDRNRFLDACRRYAYAVAIRFKCGHHGAEDSAQDAVIVVSRLLEMKPPKLAPDSIGALVRMVVLRSVHEAARRRLCETTRPAPAPREAPAAASEAETAEWARRVKKAIARLPPQPRRLVELRYWDGMSCEQIAHEVGKARRSIARWLKQAEAELRSNLLRDLDERGRWCPPRNRPGR